ncbi:MAG: ribonuclease HI family protein [bacterium]
MVDSDRPMTLLELLQTLERSQELRSLAKECGLGVKELRRRLKLWSRELTAEVAAAAAPETNPGAEPATARPRIEAADTWPELIAAVEVSTTPLPRRGSRVLEAWTDGASKGNPGPASIGIVFRQHNGEPLCSHYEAIGRATNNVAEYRAVLRALEFCQQWRVKSLNLYVDSELVARQLSGAYRVKSPSLAPLYQQAAFLARGLDVFRVYHVPREQNRHADYLANKALASKSGKRGKQPAKRS